MATYTYGTMNNNLAYINTTSNPPNVTVSNEIFTVTKPAWSVRSNNTLSESSTRFYRFGPSFFGTQITVGVEKGTTRTSIGGFARQDTNSVSSNTTWATLPSSVSEPLYTTAVFTSSNSTERIVTLTLRVGAIETQESGMGAITTGSDAQQKQNLGTCTATLNAPPTYTDVQINIDQIPTYANFSTATISISNIQAQYGGYITTVEGIIGTQTEILTYTSTSQPSETTSFQISLTEVGTFTPIIKITDSRTQTTTIQLTQNQINVEPYIITATNTKINRINVDNSKIDDEGTNAVLQTTFNYTVFTGSTLVIPEVTLSNQTITPTWYTSWNNASGFSEQVADWSTISPNTTLYAKIVGPLSMDTAHFLTIKPKTTLSEGSIVNITLPQSFYLLVGRPGGHGLGIGMKPLDDDLYIQLPTYMIKNQYDLRSTHALTIQNNSSNALTIDWNGNLTLPTGIIENIGLKLNYNSTNSETNAITVTNNSSNALTIDWNGAITIPTYRSSSWVKQRETALLKFLPIAGQTLDTNMHPYISMKSYTGDWSIAVYNNDLYVSHVTDTSYNNNTNEQSGWVQFSSGGWVTAKSGFSVNGTAISDFVVSSGTKSVPAGTARWRKWNSGKAEYWVRIVNTSGITTAVWVNPIYYLDTNTWSTMWQGVFNTTPTSVQVTSNNDQFLNIYPGSIDANGITRLRFLSCGQKTNAQYAFSVYAEGTWK